MGEVSMGGNPWARVSEGGNPWARVSMGGNPWVRVSEGGNPWVRVSMGANPWARVSVGANPWGWCVRVHLNSAETFFRVWKDFAFKVIASIAGNFIFQNRFRSNFPSRFLCVKN